MINALTTISPITHHARVNIKFDKRISIPSKTKVFENTYQADNYIDGQFQLAIRLALLKFTKQRQYILSKYPSSRDAIAQLDHVNAVLEELQYHSRTQLVVLTASVHWLRGKIFAIAPSHSSRYRKHYDEVIVPIVDWCSAHSIQARAKTL